MFSLSGLIPTLSTEDKRRKARQQHRQRSMVREIITLFMLGMEICKGVDEFTVDILKF